MSAGPLTDGLRPAGAVWRRATTVTTLSMDSSTWAPRRVASGVTEGTRGQDALFSGRLPNVGGYADLRRWTDS
jgi:hypothetical protein